MKIPAIMICVLVAVFVLQVVAANPAATPAASRRFNPQKVHLLRRRGFRQAGYLEVHDEQS